MAKYIDAEKLKAEIERLNSLVPYTNNDRHNDGLHDAYKAVKNIIDFLQQEQPEVDIEKEYKEYVEDDLVFSKLANRIVGLAIARHFYELGLNTGKEE